MQNLPPNDVDHGSADGTDASIDLSPDVTLPSRQAARGRGTGLNPDNRFLGLTVDAEDDGWMDTADATEAQSVPTQFIRENVRTIVSSNTSPDIPFDRSINPYRGCEHGCIYCYARPTHAYWDMSPGLDFETRIITKDNGPERLIETLAKKSYRCQPITIGANTDPYQPVEARLQLTRQMIQVLADCHHPFSMISRSDLIVRDLDLLAPMARRNLFTAAVTVTTLDRTLKRKMEPRAPTGKARLEAIRRLADAGIRVTMLVAPIIPCINDHELEDILAAGAEAGAAEARYIFLRLPLEISGLFQDWLHQHFPDRADHVMSLVRQSRGGKDYNSQFGVRMSGEGVFAETIGARFRIASKQHGLHESRRFDLDCTQFRPPVVGGQMVLF